MAYSGRPRTPSPMEKLIAVASYIYPLVGFIAIIAAVLMKSDMKPFLKYHIFQSIFIGFGLFLIVQFLSFSMGILSAIPIIRNIVSLLTFFLNTPLFFGFSVITFCYFLFVMYLIFGVLKNSDSYVPWVSDIIKANLRGQL